MTNIQFSGHAFTQYDGAVQNLLEKLGKMSAAATRLLSMLGNAISGQNVSAIEAKQVDKEINALEYDAIADLHQILVKYSPSLNELRYLISIVKIAAVLERVGDIAKVNIKRYEQLQTKDGSLPEPFPQAIQQMLAITHEMLETAINNMTAFNPEALSTILFKDDEVNAKYNTLIQSLHTLPKQDPLVTIIIKNIERVANHAFEMGRIAHFAHTGDKPKKSSLRENAPAQAADGV